MRQARAHARVSCASCVGPTLSEWAPRLLLAQSREQGGTQPELAVFLLFPSTGRIDATYAA